MAYEKDHAKIEEPLLWQRRRSIVFHSQVLGLCKDEIVGSDKITIRQLSFSADITRTKRHNYTVIGLGFDRFIGILWKTARAEWNKTETASVISSIPFFGGKRSVFDIIRLYIIIQTIFSYCDDLRFVIIQLFLKFAVYFIVLVTFYWRKSLYSALLFSDASNCIVTSISVEFASLPK